MEVDNFTDKLTECREVHGAIDQCAFIHQTPDCDVESLIDYVSFIFCSFDQSDQWIALVISIVWTLILFISLGVAATDFLCPALFMISKSLSMSQSVAGVTLIAFGNGSPDIFAAIAGMMAGRPELVIGALFGGACFVVMFVLGSIFTIKSFKLLPLPFLRDIIFYIIAISWVFYLFIEPKAITLWHGVGLLLYYAVYVILVMCTKFIDKNKGRDPSKSSGSGENRIIFEGVAPDDDPDSGTIIMKGFVVYRDDSALIDNYTGDVDSQSGHRLSVLNQARGRISSGGSLLNGSYAVTSQVKKKAVKAKKQQQQQQQQAQAQAQQLQQGRSNQLSVPDLQFDLVMSGLDNCAYDDSEENDLNNSKQQQAGESFDAEATSNYSSINGPRKSILTPNGLYSKNLSLYNNNLANSNSAANELTITSIKSVSICEDNNSVYDTVTSYTSPLKSLKYPSSRRGSRLSIMSTAQFKSVRKHSVQFLEKITPIDKTGWRHRNWGGKSFEVIKAPIRFFLLLTTPSIDVDPHAVPDDDCDQVDRVSWNKPLSALHCITGPLFVLFVLGYGTTMIPGTPVPVAVVVFAVASLVAILMIFTSKYETAPSYYKTYCSFLGFVVGVVWVYFISTEVVCNIRALGIAFNWSEPTIGMTILALGNCLLDFISNVSIASKGYPRMAIAASLGSPLLALLLGVGIPTTIKLATSPSGDSLILVPSTQMVTVYLAIVGSLGLTVAVSAGCKFVAQRSYGIVLICMYFTLIIIIFLAEFNVLPISYPLIGVVPREEIAVSSR